MPLKPLVPPSEQRRRQKSGLFTPVDQKINKQMNKEMKFGFKKKVLLFQDKELADIY